jgi:hypothetical protein
MDIVACLLAPWSSGKDLDRYTNAREDGLEKPPSQRSLRGSKRSKYTNWFDAKLWPLIVAAVEKHKHLRTALQYLQCTHCEKGQLTGPFDKLTCNGWTS